ncbi:hypothetical protein O77CONTIG1_02069 [Leptolyngbya sp. O-77]|nr:hypothetical protein O77CONTIG1_02069 [Leptolyngbya sp. O-77]
MTEADLALAKAFLLFSVAGYTITAANAYSQPHSVPQVVAGWADSVMTGMRGDRATKVPSSIPSSIRSSMLANRSGDISSSFSLYLSQRPALFLDRGKFLNPNAPVSQGAANSPQGVSRFPAQPLTLPPVLTKAEFQFQL